MTQELAGRHVLTGEVTGCVQAGQFGTLGAHEVMHSVAVRSA